MNKRERIRQKNREPEGKVTLVDPAGKQRKISLEDLDSINYGEITAGARRTIAMCLAASEVLPGFKEILRTHRFVKDLPEREQKAAYEITSTSMHPNFRCPYIMVGVFGSVWIDTITQTGKKVRIAINPNATSLNDATHVTEYP